MGVETRNSCSVVQEQETRGIYPKHCSLIISFLFGVHHVQSICNTVLPNVTLYN